jgi:hypothetical protein
VAPRLVDRHRSAVADDVRSQDRGEPARHQFGPTQTRKRMIGTSGQQNQSQGLRRSPGQADPSRLASPSVWGRHLVATSVRSGADGACPLCTSDRTSICPGTASALSSSIPRYLRVCPRRRDALPPCCSQGDRHRALFGAIGARRVPLIRSPRARSQVRKIRGGCWRASSRGFRAACRRASEGRGRCAGACRAA